MPESKKPTQPPVQEERCSFCGKTASEVDDMFEGQGRNVRICDQCVALCSIMMAGKQPPQNQQVQMNPFDLFGEEPAQKSRKRSPAPESIKPRELSEYLDQYVIGQGRAKKSCVRCCVQPLPENQE